MPLSVLKRSVHHVSAADNDINHVGKERCLIIANTFFFLTVNKQENFSFDEIYNNLHQV